MLRLRHRRKAAGGVMLEVEPADLPAVEDLLALVERRMADAAPPPGQAGP